MPRMVYRGKEKPGARGMSAPAMLGALIVGHGTPTARPCSKEKSSQEPDGAISRLLCSVYHIAL